MEVEVVFKKAEVEPLGNEGLPDDDAFVAIALALNASYVCASVGLTAKTIPAAQRLGKR